MENHELPTYGSDYNLSAKQGKNRSILQICDFFFLSSHLFLINIYGKRYHTYYWCYFRKIVSVYLCLTNELSQQGGEGYEI